MKRKTSRSLILQCFVDSHDSYGQLIVSYLSYDDLVDLSRTCVELSNSPVRASVFSLSILRIPVTTEQIKFLTRMPRAMCERVTCLNVESYDDASPYSSIFPNVKRFEVGYGGRSNIRSITNFSQLREVEIDKATDSDLLAVVPVWPHLVKLTLRKCNANVTILSSLKDLEQLDLQPSRFFASDVSLPRLKALHLSTVCTCDFEKWPVFPSLKELLLVDVGFTSLRGIERQATVECLNFQDCPLVFQNGDLAILSNLKRLRQLEFYHKSDEDLLQIHFLAQLPNLTHFTFNGASSEKCDIIFNSPQLRVLTLSDLELTERSLDSLVHVSGLRELSVGAFLDGPPLLAMFDAMNCLEKIELYNRYGFSCCCRHVNRVGSSLKQLSCYRQHNYRTWIQAHDPGALDEVPDFSALTQLEQLDVAGHGFKDLSNLQQLSTLKILNLSGNCVTDLTPLRFLPLLERLYLGKQVDATIDCFDYSAASSSRPIDLAPLAALTRLVQLNVSENNGVWDIRPLAELNKLQVLNIRKIKVADVSPLTELRELIALNLEATAISDISPLYGRLNSLKTLCLPSDFTSEIDLHVAFPCLEEKHSYWCYH